jgi:hypothetical protein
LHCSHFLQLKIGGDGFHLSRWNEEVNFYITLLNLGELIHSPDFVWILSTYTGVENIESFQASLSKIVEEIENIAVSGIDIQLEYIFYKFILILSGKINSQFILMWSSFFVQTIPFFVNGLVSHHREITFVSGVMYTENLLAI